VLGLAVTKLDPIFKAKIIFIPTLSPLFQVPVVSPGIAITTLDQVFAELIG